MEKVKFKIASFNVSGGFYIGEEDTEYLDRTAAETADNKLLSQIIDVVNKENIDIICFQEIITTESVKYISTIIDKTDLKYYDCFELSNCNTVKDSNCGLAILSKFKLECLEKGLFPNPGLSKTTNSGNTYYTYDKGYMICQAQINDSNIKILTHHGFPFRRFNSDPMSNRKIFEFFDDVIEQYNPDIITGDFNAENFMDIMIKTAKKYKRTINDVTTVDGKKFDDILVPKRVNCSKKIIKLLSDHYIIIDSIGNI